jgi:hypothetical protein
MLAKDERSSLFLLVVSDEVSERPPPRPRPASPPDRP